MTIYNIEIDYTTGNSFNTEQLQEDIGIATTDLAKAKENLKRIKEHYVLHKESPDFDRDYNLTLLTDSDERTINPFWIGYFETLHGANIVADDPDMGFEL